VCSASVVSEYKVTAGLGDVGSVKGGAEVAIYLFIRGVQILESGFLTDLGLLQMNVCNA